MIHTLPRSSSEYVRRVGWKVFRADEEEPLMKELYAVVKVDKRRNNTNT